MKILLALVSLLLATGLARADMVIVQRVGDLGQSGEMTMKIGEEKIRTDVSPEVSTISDATTGEVTTLMHAQKTFMVFSASAARAMMERMKQVMQQEGSAPSASPAPPKATGKTDKINGYNAAEYTFSNGAMSAVYWISSDFPNAKAVSDALAKYQKGSLADMTRAFAPDLSKIPGIPVKTEVEMNGQKIVTELISATEEAVDPVQYQVPAAYMEMKMPTVPQP